MNRQYLGAHGEHLAREYLEQRGCSIVDSNFRCRYGEIDLIIRRDRAYRFIEVKSRSTHDYGIPQESVVIRKQQRIRKTALIWLKQRHLPTDSEIHFDVLGITFVSGKPHIEYLEDAF
jgi:putative endonuclease